MRESPGLQGPLLWCSASILGAWCKKVWVGLSNHSYWEGVVKGMRACWVLSLPSSLPQTHAKSPESPATAVLPHLCVLREHLPLQSGALLLLAHLPRGARDTGCPLWDSRFHDLELRFWWNQFSHLWLSGLDPSSPPHESGHTPWVRQGLAIQLWLRNNWDL